MREGVVDLLEPVDIEHSGGERTFIATGALHIAAKPDVEGAPVLHPRDAVFHAGALGLDQEGRLLVISTHEVRIDVGELLLALLQARDFGLQLCTLGLGSFRTPLPLRLAGRIKTRLQRVRAP
jgi:hypothetical protein